jgi:carboxypeptidase T
MDMIKRSLALVMVFVFAISSLPINGSLQPCKSNALPCNSVKQAESANSTFAFDRYHDYTDIKAELERISTEYSSISQMVVMGRTWEGRDMMAMRVTDNPQNEESDEADVLIMGAHHAYELPSAEVPMYILKFLVENYAVNSSVRELVDSRDIWFVPLVNPDGREYALDVNSSWRKNRMPFDTNGDGILEGTGVDLNRNYGHLWGLQGVSQDPNNSNYCGPSAFSENETIAMRQLATTQGFELSLSYHTYGGQVSYPWNNGIDTVSPKKSILQAIATDLGERTGYTPMEGRNLYFTTGDSDDWLYSNFSTLPFTIELGSQRVVPEQDLLGLCQKNLEAALYAMKISAEPEKALLPDWTVMVYMSADADTGLASEALVDINEMEVAGSTANVSIITLYDGRGTGDSAIYRIQKDPGGLNTAIISPTVNDLGAVINPVTRELDMSNPATLRNFTAWAMENYQAQKYLLGFWGHGDGVLQEFVPDKGAGMKVNEIHQALEGFRLDIVGFDTCSLGHFEVAHELVGIADIMIGSEGLEPIAGWDYQATLQRLVLNPGTEPRVLAGYIITDYLAANSENYLTLAAIDMRVFQYDFLPRLNDFANVSQDFTFHDYDKIWAARNASNTFVTEQDAVDLFQYLENLNALNVSAPVMDRLSRLLDLKDELVFASGSGPAYPRSRAMAVYFPVLEAQLSAEYAGLAFCENRWDEYLAGIKSPTSRPVISGLRYYSANATAGPYPVGGQVDSYGSEIIVLKYRVNGAAWETAPATVSGGILWTDIPGQANGSLVEYYLLDITNNITEPYEVKWGAAEYYQFRVNASCDILLIQIWTLDSYGLVEGNATVIMMRCWNAGPEPVQANVTVRLNGTSSSKVIGWRIVDFAAGESKILEFNWTAESGNWKVIATVSQSIVFDRNVTNQERTLWVNVSNTSPVEKDFLAEYGTMIFILTLVWSIPLACIFLLLRKARRRRKAAAAQSIRAARDFVTTAAEFGGDMTDAGLFLARAEAALARNALPECEKLVRKARESAMNAVGQREVER